LKSDSLATWRRQMARAEIRFKIIVKSTKRWYCTDVQRVSNPNGGLVENQGVVALGVIAVVIIGLVVIVGGLNAWLKSDPKPKRQQPKSFPTGRRPDDPRDAELHAKITRLAAFFVRKMGEVGNPGLGAPPRWRPTSSSITRLQPNVTAHPVEIKLAGRAWWGGRDGRSCIAPGGQWEYYGDCLSYREGSSDEFSAWWVVSSMRTKPSLASSDPYPFNMYLVYDVGTATLRHAYQDMVGMMERYLLERNPSALREFHALRGA
jgi:hypothetical protein